MLLLLLLLYIRVRNCEKICFRKHKQIAHTSHMFPSWIIQFEKLFSSSENSYWEHTLEICFETWSINLPCIASMRLPSGMHAFYPNAPPLRSIIYIVLEALNRVWLSTQQQHCSSFMMEIVKKSLFPIQCARASCQFVFHSIRSRHILPHVLMVFKPTCSHTLFIIYLTSYNTQPTTRAARVDTDSAFLIKRVTSCAQCISLL